MLFGQHTRRTSLPWPSVLAKLVCALAIVCVFGFGSDVAEAKSKPRPVQGTFQTQIQPPEACPAPLYLCASGIATGDIEGDVSVVIDQSTIVVENGVPFSRYSGSISVSSPKGELTGHVNGQVRLTDGALSSVVTFTDGTRGYHATTGTLDVTGTINLLTGTEYDTYQGSLTNH
jgi:hypothetical protein